MIITRSFGVVSRGCMFANGDARDYAFDLGRVAEAECWNATPWGGHERRLAAIRLHGRKDFILLDMEWDKFVRLKKK